MEAQENTDYDELTQGVSGRPDTELQPLALSHWLLDSLTLKCDQCRPETYGTGLNVKEGGIFSPPLYVSLACKPWWLCSDIKRTDLKWGVKTQGKKKNIPFFSLMLQLDSYILQRGKIRTVGLVIEAESLKMIQGLWLKSRKTGHKI